MELIGDTKEEMLEDFRRKVLALTIDQLDKFIRDYTHFSHPTGTYSRLYETMVYEAGKRRNELINQNKAE